MTNKEAVLVSAYTGFLLTKRFSDVHVFCEELLGRPIHTHEFAFDSVHQEIRDKCLPMIKELVENERFDGELPGVEKSYCLWCQDHNGKTDLDFSVLDDAAGAFVTMNTIRYCPFCGRDLKERKNDQI